MKRFKNIVYVNEPSATPDHALAGAVELARNNQARLAIIDVVAPITAGIGMPPGGPISAELQTAMIAERRRELEASIAPHRHQLQIAIDVRVGVRFLEIIRSVLLEGYDLLIKVSENPDYIARLFGSDDMHLLRKCPCPVWLIKPQQSLEYESILAAVDVGIGLDSEENDAEERALNATIVELAASLALSDSTALHLAHAWDAPEAGFISLWSDNPQVAEENLLEAVHSQHEQAMTDLNDNLRQRVGADTYRYIAPRIHMPRGEARTAIPRLARELKADLVVMGTLARSGIAGFFIGNTAEAILEQLQCSVLAIKPPGFKSPVQAD